MVPLTRLGALTKPRIPVAWLSGPILAGFILICAPAIRTSAQEPARADDGGKAVLPGRIFVLGATLGDPFGGLVAIDPNEGTWVRVAGSFTGGAPRISPDGRKFAWSGPAEAGGKAKVWVEDITRESKPVKVLEEGRFAICVWSPDSSELLISVAEAPGHEQCRVWRVAADGSKAEPLPIPETETVVDWSTDGRWLITLSSRRPDGESSRGPLGRPYYLMHPDGTGERLITPRQPDPSRTLSPPRLSPDGRSLLWVEREWEGTDRRALKRSVIAVGDLDGGPPREIVRGEGEKGHAYLACWSPDGKTIAAGLLDGWPEETASRLVVFDLEGRRVRSIDMPEAAERQLRIVIDWR